MSQEERRSKDNLLQELNEHMVPFDDAMSKFEDGESIVEFSMFENSPFGQNKIMVQVYFDKDNLQKYDCIVR